MKKVIAMLVLLAIVLPSQGQRQDDGPPHIAYVYPAGGQRGTTNQVVVGGQFLDGVYKAYLSGRGIQVAVVTHTRPLALHEHHDLMIKLQQLQKARGGDVPNASNNEPAAKWTNAQENLLQLIRLRLANSTVTGRLPNPALADVVTLRITLSPNAELGERELRLLTPRGLTNPLKYFVGQLPEIMEKPFVNVRGDGDKKPAATPAKEMRITPPATINGQILPGGINRYRFVARQGQRLVAAVSARSLNPYLPDTVPGWVQATMKLSDAAGQELEYADHCQFSPDPVLYYTIPKAGEYTLEIRDSLYRGRDDFVYRITLGEQPFVAGIFPLGGQTDHPATVTLRGANLPVNQVTLNTHGNLPGIYPVPVCQGDGVHNNALFAVDTLPECFEKEPNDDPATAQLVTLPIIVNGHIDAPGDKDVFRFEGRFGQTIVAEVVARRLNSPLDSLLIMADAAGKQLASNDDYEDKGAGLLTQQADSYLRITLPADGTYYLHLRDTLGQGGPDYVYRLRLSEPRPDFQLRIVPSSINARAGANTLLTVYALRRDGFTNAIAFALKDAPKGFQLSGGQVPANQDQAKLTLTVPPTPTTDPINLTVEGYAQIGHQKIVRRAVPADDLMQAFAYRHLVVAHDLKVAVLEQFTRNTGRILGDTPIKIPAGKTARVRIWLSTNMLLAEPELELCQAPKGITITDTYPVRENIELVLQSNAAMVKPGQKGTLLVKVIGQRPRGRDQNQSVSNRSRVPLGTLPPIPFEIVAP